MGTQEGLAGFQGWVNLLQCYTFPDSVLLYVENDLLFDGRVESYPMSYGVLNNYVSYWKSSLYSLLCVTGLAE